MSSVVTAQQQQDHNNNNIPWFGLSELAWNGVVTVGTVAYAVTLVGVCEALVSRRILSSAISRKILHLGAASWIIFWPLYVVSDDDDDGGDGSSSWSWKLNVALPAVKGVVMLVKGALIRDPNDKDVRSMSRSGNPTELLYGPLQFTAVMTTLGLVFFRHPVACLVMGTLGVGDGCAPLFAGKHKYKTVDGSGIKSVEGSLVVFAGSILGYYVYSWIVTALPLLPLSAVVLCAAVAAVVEGLTPSDLDNITIPVTMYFMYRLVAE